MLMLVFLLLLLVAGVAGAAVLLLRNKAAFERSNELLPGTSTSAPASWAGSHDPEARLHRRLRDAMVALRANQAFDLDGTLLDLRVDLEQNAVALDEQLVATAALPVHLRGEPLARIVGAVEAIEQAVADLAGSTTAEIGTRLTGVLDDVRVRTDLVAQARTALDALDAGEPAAGTSASPAPEDPGATPAGATPGDAEGKGPGPADPGPSGTEPDDTPRPQPGT
ncbi:hypothetical protein BH23ACT2_BH23ACT2_20140 [soil metagenome]